jgi:undecaprenyl-diphosphatase
VLQAAELGASAPGVLDVTILALLQGLTEFLPVSSSGHLVLAEHLLGLREGGLALVVALHVGTLLSVLAVYAASVRETLVDLARGRPAVALKLVLASLPAALIGIGFEDWIEQRFGDARGAAWGLLATAAVLAAAEFMRRKRARARTPERPIGAGTALAIGVAQAVAILPGVSRSGATISTALALGVNPVEAARFSFLMSLIAVGGAALLQARELGGEDPGSPGVLLIAWGVVLSAVTGWFALRLLIAFLGRGAFGWFALYCATVGIAWLSLT